MTVVPYSRVFVGRIRSVAVSGSRIYVLDSATGVVVASSASNVAEEQGKGKATNAGPIVAAAVNEDFTYLLTVAENKMLKLWELPGLKLVNERELPKRPTGLAFTKDSQTIIVSDKFGDVFSYPFNYVPPATKPTRDEFSSHENPSDGQLILGHASPLNTFLLSHDEKYIITADRDEHIRVSWYPQGYNIEMYCLGHRKYVSAIHLPKFAPDTLISGGGDPSLKFWDWMTGRCIGEVQIWDSVEPFVTVKSNKRKRGEEDEDEEGGSVTQKRKGKGKKSKRRGDKQKNVQNKKGDEEEGEGEDKEGGGGEGEQEGENVPEVIEEKVLVVSKIGSVQRGDAKFVIFSAVGVTALFGFQYPTGPIERFDFGYPIIDFVIDGNGEIWVSLDTNWSGPGAEAPKDSRLARVVQFNGIGKFTESSLSSESHALLKSLNETCAVTGSPCDIPNNTYLSADSSDRLFDFYADLKGMPKWSEPSAQIATAGSTKDAAESVSSAISKPLTRREEARMKNKKNVLAKMQKMVQGEAVSEKIGTVRSHEDVEGGDMEEGREAKRAKPVVEGSGDDDVDMKL